MSNWKYALLASAVAIAPVPAFAAPTEAPIAEVVAPDATVDPTSEAALADAKAKMQKEIDEAIALIERIFGVDELPPIAPEQLALARRTTTALVPAGSFEKMMDNLYGKLFRGLLDEFGGTTDLTLSYKTGIASEKIAALDAPSKEAAADLFDPHRKEREDQIMKVVKPLISEALADMEPPLREGLAHAYARKFSAEHLTQMNEFFATPAGTAYAAEWMSLQADPEVMLAMIKAVPPLVNKFIDRGPELQADFKELPKERQLADLGDAELAKLAGLMKVDVQELKDYRDMMDAPMAEEAMTTDAEMTGEWGDDSAAAAADAAEAAADAAADAEWHPAYDRANWSETDRQRVEDLEAASDEAATAAYEAQQEAIENARRRTPPTE